MTERSEHRFIFVESRVHEDGESTRSVVVLRDATGVTFEGTAEHEGDGADVWSSAAAATEALRSALKLPEAALRLRDVTAFEISGEPAVAVALRLQVEGPKRRLFGLSHVEEDRGRSAALAVLGATNRVLGSF